MPAKSTKNARANGSKSDPAGTEYHWYVLAHQNVLKLNANEYTTSLAGLKFKIAHRRADTEKWSATPKTQRKRMIKFLKEMIAQLETQSDEAVTSAESPVTKSRSKKTGMPKSMTQRPPRRRRVKA